VLALGDRLAQLAADAAREVAADGIAAERIEIRRSLDLRYRGVEQALTIAEPLAGSYAEAFAAEHHKLYGYLHAGRELEIVAARVEVRGRSESSLAPTASVAGQADPGFRATNKTVSERETVPFLLRGLRKIGTVPDGFVRRS